MLVYLSLLEKLLFLCSVLLAMVNSLGLTAGILITNTGLKSQIDIFNFSAIIIQPITFPLLELTFLFERFSPTNPQTPTLHQSLDPLTFVAVIV